MNLRYRVLNIGEERYILDMGGSSFWRILFPFFYWLLPITVYKVKDHELIEKIVSPYIEQKSIGWQSWLGGMLTLGLGNLLRPLVDYFDMDSTTFINVIIVSIVFILIISFFFYVNIRSEKKLNQVINLKQFRKEYVWIRVKSSMHIFQVLFSYLFFLGLTVLLLGGFIQTSNGFILFAGTLILFLILVGSYITIQVGDTTVRFKGNNS